MQQFNNEHLQEKCLVTVMKLLCNERIMGWVYFKLNKKLTKLLEHFLKHSNNYFLFVYEVLSINEQRFSRMTCLHVVKIVMSEENLLSY